MGDTCHLKLNISKRPIANKYREGKMKRTLKRESKVREIVIRETNHAAPGPGASGQPFVGLAAWRPDPVDPLEAACRRAMGRWLPLTGAALQTMGGSRPTSSVDVCRGRRAVARGGPSWPAPRHSVPSSTLWHDPTRLETRTKECNSDASHWVANPRAQRK